MKNQQPDSIKNTVNLPQTDFPIRAGLANLEPQLLEKWEKENITKQIEDHHQDDPHYTLHDGPPYPNGNIHIGHALNKTLKDIVVKSQTMAGHYSHYIPGWDCHGLPIETQVIKDLKSKNEEHKKQDVSWFRNRCKEFALDYVELQKQDFKQLGCFGNWDTPYLTLNANYEAHTIRSFGKMAENGLIYKGRKPIHWCTHCETALAEAEIEYAEHRSPSITFTFTITTPSQDLASLLQDTPGKILVWTTTPWTLPSNVAIAAHPNFTYVLLKSNDQILIAVQELKDALIEKLNLEHVETIGTISGKQLEGTITKHPFIDRESPVVTADYVTNEDGTGFVHIAPGHGQDDFIVGKTHNLPTIMPVDDSGRYTKEVPQWEGKKVFDANKDIGMHMDENGSLLHLQFIKHSYPHCWRCKNPVIFRATEQWFVSMDTPLTNQTTTLRDLALSTIKSTKWVPDWGEKRITAMIENRPDWCISRQRYWGIPIPVLTCQDCNHSEMTGDVNEAIAKKVEEHGTLIWFEKEASDLCPDLACSKCGSKNFKKESDILDVWFESGSSFASVLKENPNTNYPAELYLEGSDQHRGWFQSSLLIGLGAEGKAPFKTVLTHGFLVDEKGKKMSKSQGNTLSPEKIIKEYGADILRWWVASSDFKNDISISKNVLNQARDTFSKVRNTIRFCISNLYDFDPTQDTVDYNALNAIDQWGLHQLTTLNTNVQNLYNKFDTHIITHTIHDFCAVTLSNLYLDMTKDRLYCDDANSQTRRSTQTVLYHLVDTLIKLITPILPFTAEDAYSHFNTPSKAKSVHLTTFSQLPDSFHNPELDQKWKTILNARNTIYQDLEKLRKAGEIRSFLEAHVSLSAPQELLSEDWESILIVSRVTKNEGSEIQATVEKIESDKCARCWKLLPLTETLCERCHPIVTKATTNV